MLIQIFVLLSFKYGINLYFTLYKLYLNDSISLGFSIILLLYSYHWMAHHIIFWYRNTFRDRAYYDITINSRLTFDTPNSWIFNIRYSWTLNGNTYNKEYKYRCICLIYNTPITTLDRWNIQYLYNSGYLYSLYIFLASKTSHIALTVINTCPASCCSDVGGNIDPELHLDTALISVTGRVLDSSFSLYWNVTGCKSSFKVSKCISYTYSMYESNQVK